MATPSVVNSYESLFSSSGPGAIAVASATDGNLMVVGIGQRNDSPRTFATTDDETSPANSYSAAVTQQGNTNRCAAIHYAKNINGWASSQNVTVTPTGGTTNWSTVIQEVANCSTTSPADTTGSNVDTTNGTSHDAASPAINTTTDVYVMCVFVFTAGAGAIGTGSYTDIYSGANAQHHAQSRVSASALTSETGSCTSGSSVQGVHCMASFKADAAGGAAARIWQLAPSYSSPTVAGNIHEICTA